MTEASQSACSYRCHDHEVPSGPLSSDSAFYIERPPLEEQVMGQVMQAGSLVRLKAPRRMGKSSLLLRLSKRLSTLEYVHCTIDFLQADTACFDKIDAFLRWFCRIVAFQMGLSSDLAPYWDSEIGSKVSATLFFEHYLLRQVAKPLVLSMNEVNRVFEYSAIAEDFLSLLRFWHEQGQRSPLWQNLRLVMAYSTDVYVPLKLEQSPFNVGTQFRLPKFTLEQVHELARRYGLASEPGSEQARTIDDLVALVGGHPYLTHMAIARLAQTNCSPHLLLQSASELQGLFGEDLQHCSASVQARPALVEAIRQLLKAPVDGVRLPSSIAYQLDSLGIVTRQNYQCQFSCELYRRHFKAEFSALDWEANGLQIENQRLQTLAYTDALTRIPNRRAFDLRLLQAWQNGLLAQSSLTLMLADVDHFKRYNDAYGHPMGDQCLQLVAQILQRQVRSELTDFVARYGGEEFAVILPNLTLEIAQERAEQLRSQVRAITAASALPGVTLSIGLVTIFPTPKNAPDRMLAAADRVLYESKRLGRDRVTVITTL